MERAVSKTLACAILLTVITYGVFAWTVWFRWSWVTSSGAGEEDAEGVMLVYIRNWWREGYFHLRGGAFPLPRSIELNSRAPGSAWPSFPTGHGAVTQFLARFSNWEPTIRIGQFCNQANHGFIAFILSLTIFIFLRQLRYSHLDAWLFALIPMSLELLTPAPLIWHKIGFFTTDIAVPVPFAFLIFLEVLRDSFPRGSARAKTLAGLQSLTIFGGLMIDWLFVFVTGCLYLKRLVHREMGTNVATFVGKSILFWSSFVAGIALFILQSYALGTLGGVGTSITRSTGIAHLPLRFPGILFWVLHMRRGYGRTGIAIVLGSFLCFLGLAAYAAIRRVHGRPIPWATSRSLDVIFLLFVPCFLHLTAFSVHSAFILHFFSMFKFILPFATVPFVLLPVALANLGTSSVRHDSAGKLARRSYFFPTIMLVLAWAYLLVGAPEFMSGIARKNGNPETIAMGSFIGENTRYEDVVFATDSNFSDVSTPKYIGYAMKVVHSAPTLEMMHQVVAPVQGEYVVNILTRAGEELPPDSPFGKLVVRAFEHRAGNGFRLDKIRKADFLALCKESGVVQ